MSPAHVLDLDSGAHLLWGGGNLCSRGDGHLLKGPSLGPQPTISRFIFAAGLVLVSFLGAGHSQEHRADPGHAPLTFFVYK